MTNELLELENDPVPVVRIFGARFKRALRQDSFKRRVRKFRGCIALASNKDPQALTIRSRDGKIRLNRGVAADAAIVIRLDFERIGEPGYSPKVEGLMRHPLLAYKTSRLLDFPAENWPDAAGRFWKDACHMDRMPGSIKVLCEDDGREILLGDEEEPEVEIHGDTRALLNLFTGSSILVQSVMKRQIRIVSSFEHMAVLSHVTQRVMLGEIGCE